MSPHSIFGWSYPPGCSGPPDEGPGPSVLVEEVLGLLEDAGVPEQINDQIEKLIETWEQDKAQKEAGIVEPEVEVDDPAKLVPPPDDQEPQEDPCRDYDKGSTSGAAR